MDRSGVRFMVSCSFVGKVCVDSWVRYRLTDPMTTDPSPTLDATRLVAP